MRKLLTVGLVISAMVIGAFAAEAGGRPYKGRHGHGGYHHGYYGGIGDRVLIAAGIIGGSILLGGLLSRPHYPPAPVYYAPPRPRYCEQDRVYRYLPNGRIQWGTRTTCY